ncbi:MAG TPA: PIN domain nuclease [Desulfobulbaceae bacterium]|nr:PIN domain nuclease [Desulfobulbaceae bacterium]
MSILIDTSVWIDYFRHGGNAEVVDFLIDEDIIVINDIILAELVPFLRVRNQRALIDLLFGIERLEMSADWLQIMEYQYTCLKSGLNGIAIPDLLIAQNARQNAAAMYSLDGHFQHLQGIIGLTLYP